MSILSLRKRWRGFEFKCFFFFLFIFYTHKHKSGQYFNIFFSTILPLCFYSCVCFVPPLSSLQFVQVTLFVCRSYNKRWGGGEKAQSPTANTAQSTAFQFGERCGAEPVHCQHFGPVMSCGVRLWVTAGDCPLLCGCGGLSDNHLRPDNLNSPAKEATLSRLSPQWPKHRWGGGALLSFPQCFQHHCRINIQSLHAGFPSP